MHRPHSSTARRGTNGVFGLSRLETGCVGRPNCWLGRRADFRLLLTGSACYAYKQQSTCQYNAALLINASTRA